MSRRSMLAPMLAIAMVAGMLSWSPDATAQAERDPTPTARPVPAVPPEPLADSAREPVPAQIDRIRMREKPPVMPSGRGTEKFAGGEHRFNLVREREIELSLFGSDNLALLFGALHAPEQEIFFGGSGP